MVGLVDQSVELVGIHLVQHPHHTGGELRNRRGLPDVLGGDLLAIMKWLPPELRGTNPM